MVDGAGADRRDRAAGTRRSRSRSGVDTPLHTRRRSWSATRQARPRRSRRREGFSRPARTRVTSDRRRVDPFETRAPRDRSHSSMSTGFAAIPLLKAAPEPDQLADRLEGGPWRGLELALMPPGTWPTTTSLARAIEVVRNAARRRSRGHGGGARWPGRAARSCASTGSTTRHAPASSAAEFAAGDRLAGPHDPPLRPDDARRSTRAGGGLDERADRARSCASTPTRASTRGRDAAASRTCRRCCGCAPAACTSRPSAATGATCSTWRERVPELRLHARHVARGAVPQLRGRYPSLFGLDVRRTSLELERYVEELGPATEVAHVSDAHGLLGEGLPYGTRRARPRPGRAPLGELVPYVVAEINEPDPARSPDMKAGYRAHRARVRAAAARPGAGRRAACRARPSTGSACCSGATRCRRCSSCRSCFGGRRVLDHRRRRLDRRLAGHAARSASAPSASRCSTPTRPRSPPTAARATPLARRAHGARALRHPRRRPRWRWSSAARGPTSSSTSPPTSTSTGPSATRRSSWTTTCTAAGTCCARPRRPAWTRSWSPPPTRRRSPPASTAAPSASWSSSPPTPRAAAARGAPPFAS